MANPLRENSFSLLAIMIISQKMNRPPIRNGERCTFKFNTNINFNRVQIFNCRFL